jgi:hypothetical protein
MNISTKSLLTVVLLLVSSTGLAQRKLAIASFESGVVNVLVKVEEDGSVKHFLAAEQFPPQLERLLAGTMKGLAITPSPTASSKRVHQVVLRFKLETSERSDGTYDARWVAFESRPVPFGPWFWATSDEKQLVLVEGYSPLQQAQLQRFLSVPVSSNRWDIQSPFREANRSPQNVSQNLITKR